MPFPCWIPPKPIAQSPFRQAQLRRAAGVGRADSGLTQEGDLPFHFHLVAETPQANLVVGMKWLSWVYTKRFPIRHILCGHLLAGRYKALIVDGSGRSQPPSTRRSANLPDVPIVLA